MDQVNKPANLLDYLNQRGAYNMSKKKEVTSGDLVKIEPITDNQKRVFESYSQGKSGFYFGSAGTGKTFISYLTPPVPVSWIISFSRGKKVKLYGLPSVSYNSEKCQE